MLLSNVSLEAWLDALRCEPRECCLAYAQRPEYYLDCFSSAAVGRQPDEYPLVYLHVPFCRPSSADNRDIDDARWNDAQLVNGYIDALLHEIEEEEGCLRQATAVEIGGGMPTILPTTQLERIVRRAASLVTHATEPHPLSICISPRIAGAEPDKVKMLSEAGIGQISLRLQGPADELASQLERQARESCAIKAVENIRAAGIARLHLELAFGCPGQTLENWLSELEFALQLQSDAMTLTPCLRSVKGGPQHDPPTLEQLGALYDLAYDFLKGRGFNAPYAGMYFSRLPNASGASAYFHLRQREGLAFRGLGCFAESVWDDQWRFRRMAVDDYVAASPAELSAAERCRIVPLEERAARHLTDALNFGTIDTDILRKVEGVEVEHVFSEAFRLAKHEGWLKPHDDGHGWGVPFGQYRAIGYLKSLFYTEKCRLWLLRHYVAPSVLADAATFANAP